MKRRMKCARSVEGVRGPDNGPNHGPNNAWNTPKLAEPTLMRDVVALVLGSGWFLAYSGGAWIAWREDSRHEEPRPGSLRALLGVKP